jgi:hypothetical protein
MMKNNNKKKANTAKKLLPAAMMLAVSASMLGTSTYAWFSMNKTVSVQSMSISAKSADAIIEISANGSDFHNALATGNGGNWTLPDATNAPLKLVTPTAISTSEGTVGNVSWGWAASTAHDNAQVGNATTPKALVAQTTPSKTENNRAAYLGIENDSLYVLTQKLTIRNVSPDVVATNLKINSVSIDKGNNTIGNAVRVLFVAADGKYAMYEPDANNGTTATLVSTHQWLDAQGATATDMSTSSNSPIVAATLAAKGTGNSPAAGSSTDVDVYVFFDGTDADAYTDLATNLSDVSVQFTFGID